MCGFTGEMCQSDSTLRAHTQTHKQDNASRAAE